MESIEASSYLTEYRRKLDTANIYLTAYRRTLVAWIEDNRRELRGSGDSKMKGEAWSIIPKEDPSAKAVCRRMQHSLWVCDRALSMDQAMIDEKWQSVGFIRGILWDRRIDPVIFTDEEFVKLHPQL